MFNWFKKLYYAAKQTSDALDRIGCVTYETPAAFADKARAERHEQLQRRLAEAGITVRKL